MKNIILFVLISFISFGYANSQTRERYVFDNFEASTGIRVRTTPSTALPATVQAENKLSIQKTTQSAMSIGNALSLKNNASPIVKLVNKTVMAAGRGLAGFSTGDATIDSYIVESSARYNIDPLLIYAQMHQESGFKRRATSYKGASGLMQLMPPTAMRFGVTNIYDPKQNIDAGIKYMRWLINKFNGDVNLALAGYNAGEGAVMKYGNQIPPYKETQNYVRKISSHYNSIKKTNSAGTEKNISQLTIAQSPQLNSTVSFERNTLVTHLSHGKTQLANR